MKLDRATTRSTATTCKWLGLFAVWAAFPACGSADAARTVRFDLGRIPPGWRGKIQIDPPELPANARLNGLSTSCGCLETRLVANDVEVRPGSAIPASTGVRLHVVFAARGAKSRSGKETIRIALESNGVRSHRFVDVQYVIDPAASVLLDREQCSVHCRVPIKEFRHQIALRRPLAMASIEMDEKPWLKRDNAPAQGGDAQVLSLIIGPIDTNGEYEAAVRFMAAESGHEEFLPHLHAEAPEGHAFSPGQVVLSVPVGGSVVHPVSLRGRDLDVEPSVCLWQWIDRGPARLSLTVKPEAERLARLLFHVEDTRRPGLHRGRLRVRPNATADYYLALPFLVRVY